MVNGSNLGLVCGLWFVVCSLVCDLLVGLVTMFVTSSWLASDMVVVGG